MSNDKDAATGLVIGGTTSDAGKSLIATGLCRVLSRRGVRVAPFKGQNMSNNSMVVPGGAEIGRAQWLQAQAAKVTPRADFNPILLKPGSQFMSHIIVRGKPYDTVHASNWHDVRPVLKQAAFEALAAVRADFDVVIAEGAGSPAEVNLRADDFTNIGLAAHAKWPMLVVGDIDKGGLLAAFYGTVGIVPEDDQRLIAAWLVNKFRGSQQLLQPGLDQLDALTGRPTLGVIPYLDDVWVDAEDSLSAAKVAAAQRFSHEPARSHTATLRVAVVRFPRMSNTTDVDALAAEPGVRVEVTEDAGTLAEADLVVLPGSRQTLDDLAWLREQGLATVVERRHARHQPVLGICGGYQMLSETLEDSVESRDLTDCRGLGLLPVRVTFHHNKVLATPEGQWRGVPVGGYEIHHGTVTRTTGDVDAAFLDGWQVGATFGTLWHGALEHDAFRRAFLGEVSARTGKSWTPTTAPGFAELREQMINSLADALEEHANVPAILQLIDDGVPPDLPTRPAGFV